jgi:hypothetical protein
MRYTIPFVEYLEERRFLSVAVMSAAAATPAVSGATSVSAPFTITANGVRRQLVVVSSNGQSILAFNPARLAPQQIMGPTVPTVAPTAVPNASIATPVVAQTALLGPGTVNPSTPDGSVNVTPGTQDISTAGGAATGIDITAPTGTSGSPDISTAGGGGAGSGIDISTANGSVNGPAINFATTPGDTSTFGGGGAVVSTTSPLQQFLDMNVGAGPANAVVNPNFATTGFAPVPLLITV